MANEVSMNLVYYPPQPYRRAEGHEFHWSEPHKGPPVCPIYWEAFLRERFPAERVVEVEKPVDTNHARAPWD